MIKNDKWIAEQARQGMISPFEEKSIRNAVLGAERQYRLLAGVLVPMAMIFVYLLTILEFLSIFLVR